MNYSKILLGSMSFAIIGTIAGGAYFLNKMATELDETKKQLAKVEATSNSAVVNAGKAAEGANDALAYAKKVGTATSDVLVKTKAVEKMAADALLIAKAGNKKATDTHDLAAALKSGVGTLKKEVASRAAFSVESGELRFDRATFKILTSRDAVESNISIDDVLRKSIGDSADTNGLHHVIKVSTWADAVIETEGNQVQGQEKANRGITLTIKLKKPAGPIIHSAVSLQGFEIGSGSKMHLESSVTDVGDGQFDIRVWTSADADAEIRAVRVKWVAITAASVGN
jgi:hypothetical protein